jgi:hypothetical protein
MEFFGISGKISPLYLSRFSKPNIPLPNPYPPAIPAPEICGFVKR